MKIFFAVLVLLSFGTNALAGDEFLSQPKGADLFAKYTSQCRKIGSNPSPGMHKLIDELGELGLHISSVTCGKSSHGYPDNPATMLILTETIPKQKIIEYYVQFSRTNSAREVVVEITKDTYLWRYIEASTLGDIRYPGRWAFAHNKRSELFIEPQSFSDENQTGKVVAQ